MNGIELLQQIRNLKIGRTSDNICSCLLFKLAGETARVGNPILSDFVLIGQRLEKLGLLRP